MAGAERRSHGLRWVAAGLACLIALVGGCVWNVSQMDLFAGPPTSPDDCADSDVDLIRHSHLGEVQAVREAIADGADVDERDEHENTPLACVHPLGTPEIVAALLEAGAEPDVEDRFGDTVVADAVRFCHDDVLQLLLDAGANPDYGGKDGSPLDQAVGRGRVRAVRILLAAGADPDLGEEPDVFGDSEEESDCPPHSTATEREVLGLVLEAGGDPEAVLATAADMQAWAAVPDAVAAGADPDLDLGWSLYDLACTDDPSGEIDPRRCSPTAGLTSLSGRQTDAPSFDEDGERDGGDLRPITPLLRVAWAGETEVVRALLAAGADPNLVGFADSTALAAAAGAGHDDIVGLLLPVVTVPLPAEAILPSQVAAAAGHTELADVLLFAGA